MTHIRHVPGANIGANSNEGGSATALPWGSVTSKPDWVGTINARVDALEASGSTDSEATGNGFTPATSLFEDGASFYFVIPNDAAWRVRQQNKGDLSVTNATSETEPTTLADAQSLEYA